MVPFDLHVIRLFVHVLAAAVWVGGQIVLVGLLPTARSLGDDVPRQIGRAFNKVAWPAYALLVITGLWNLMEVALTDRPTKYHVVLLVKLLFVAASGIGAAFHTKGGTKVALAVGGSMAGLGGLAAMLLGIWMHG